jgi:hypothetical protein
LPASGHAAHQIRFERLDLFVLQLHDPLHLHRLPADGLGQVVGRLLQRFLADFAGPESTDAMDLVGFYFSKTLKPTKYGYWSRSYEFSIYSYNASVVVG